MVFRRWARKVKGKFIPEARERRTFRPFRSSTSTSQSPAKEPDHRVPEQSEGDESILGSNSYSDLASTYSDGIFEDWRPPQIHRNAHQPKEYKMSGALQPDLICDKTPRLRKPAHGVSKGDDKQRWSVVDAATYPAPWRFHPINFFQPRITHLVFSGYSGSAMEKLLGMLVQDSGIEFSPLFNDLVKLIIKDSVLGNLEFIGSLASLKSKSGTRGLEELLLLQCSFEPGQPASHFPSGIGWLRELSIVHCTLEFLAGVLESVEQSKIKISQIAVEGNHAVQPWRAPHSNHLNLADNSSIINLRANSQCILPYKSASAHVKNLTLDLRDTGSIFSAEHNMRSYKDLLPNLDTLSLCFHTLTLGKDEQGKNNEVQSILHTLNTSPPVNVRKLVLQPVGLGRLDLMTREFFPHLSKLHEAFAPAEWALQFRGTPVQYLHLFLPPSKLYAKEALKRLVYHFQPGSAPDQSFGFDHLVGLTLLVPLDEGDTSGWYFKSDFSRELVRQLRLLLDHRRAKLRSANFSAKCFFREAFGEQALPVDV